MKKGSIIDVPGIKVGHVENTDAVTGCTVVLPENGACAGVEVRGSAPGTKETDLLDPVNTVNEVHGIVLTGGSAFGLDAASGVMQYLEEHDIGLDVGVAKVPIVPAAALFDLPVGNGNIRPDKQMGYQAAKKAVTHDFSEGNVGAGCGATVGKITGLENCMKGGLGTASIDLGDGVAVGAVVAVNAFGDVRDSETGEILAGTYDRKEEKLIDSLEFMQHHSSQSTLPGANTTIGVIAVNAELTKAQARKVAQMAHNGYARTIFPVHTMQDGDTIFVLATGGKRVTTDLIGTMAAKAMEQAIVSAIKHAEGIPGIPAYQDMK